MPKPQAKKQRATFSIRFPIEKGVKVQPVVNTLRHWNTHYKSMHEWEDGRVEVINDRRVKGYDDPKCEMLDFSCPYCRQRLYYRPVAVHEVKGNIRCTHCKKPFGVHPNGQVFVVRSVERKVKTSKLLKDKVMKWAAASTTYLDAYVFQPGKGDDSVEVEVEYWEYEDHSKFDKNLSDFVSMLDDSGFEYRRVS